MGIAAGLMLFVVFNSINADCLTCDMWDNLTASKAKTEPSKCQFGEIQTGPNIQDFRCMFEDEYYKITEDPIISPDAFTIENLQTCTNVNGVIWCSQP